MEGFQTYEDFKKQALGAGWIYIGRYNFSNSGYIVYEWRTPATMKITITCDMDGNVRGSCTTGGWNGLDFNL